MKTIIVGLGNPILGDDGVGWKVAEEVKNQMKPTPEVDVDCLALGGISLMEHLIGYQRAIVIDAILCEDEPGSIHVLELDSLSDPSVFHLTSAHDTSLQTAMKLGRAMHVPLPEDVIVVGVSIRRAYDFSEELSPAITEALPKAVQIIMGLTM
jgi:hydrogenase maturation protease